MTIEQILSRIEQTLENRKQEQIFANKNSNDKNARDT
jgi:hypothetical protein